MSALGNLNREAASADIAALVEEARNTDSWVRYVALMREIALILGEERYEAGPIDSQDVYFRQVGVIPMLSAGAELNLFERMEKEQGQKAKVTREKLIRSHLRLAIAIAREYRGRGLPFLDLIQEGNLGLEKAVDRFDYRKGNRLSTYAIWSIHSAIWRALANKARTIRVPVSVQQKLIKISRAERYFSGREPTNKELAWHTRLSIEEIEWLKRCTTPPVSLDAPLSEQNRERLELLADEETPSPEQAVIQAESEKAVQDAMSHLLHRQRTVLELRFGFGRREPMSLEKVGDELGLSRERVRQIEGEALERLRELLKDEVPRSAAA